MDEQDRAEFFRLRPNGIEFGVGEFHAVDITADCSAAQPCRLTAVSSSRTASSGACNVSEAKAAKRSAWAAQSSASFSF